MWGWDRDVDEPLGDGVKIGKELWELRLEMRMISNTVSLFV